MKKVLSVFLSVILVFSASFNVTALNSADIYGDDIKTAPGSKISIPVYIKNNPGLMGYKIRISYDSSAFTPVAVKQGTTLTGGMFDNSDFSASKTYFDVVWSNSSEVEANGLLFTVDFNVLPSAGGDYSIKISYSKDDTFNEKWEEVRLNCDTVNVFVDDGSESEPTPTPRPEPTPEVTKSFLDKIIDFFRMIIDFLSGLFATSSVQEGSV